MKSGAVGRWLPPFAVGIFALGVAAIVAAAGRTLGYDEQAYVEAARRLLHHQPLYDTSVNVAGGFAIYLYPPPFAFGLVQFALLPNGVDVWAWLLVLVAAFLAGVAILPVRREVRWAIVLLAGLSWPFLYSLKLGQVGPLLFLAFAVGWRSLDRPWPLGASIAAGTVIKLQPALLLAWAVVTRRFRAAAVAIGVLVAMAVLVTPVVGVHTWIDYVDLLRRVSTPVTTPHNFTPGAIAYQAGIGESAAGLVQVAAMAAALLVAAWSWVRSDAETSFITTVVATQLLSPLLWDHYAMLLLLPTALLLQRRQWWAVAIPLAGWLPAAVYPVLFAVCLLAPVLTGARRPRMAASRAVARAA